MTIDNTLLRQLIASLAGMQKSIGPDDNLLVQAAFDGHAGIDIDGYNPEEVADGLHALFDQGYIATVGGLTAPQTALGIHFNHVTEAGKRLL